MDEKEIKKTEKQVETTQVASEIPDNVKQVENEQVKGENLNTVHKQKTSAKLAKMGLMIAISCVIGILKFPVVPTASFLTYDFSDVPTLITGFAFGPLSGLLVLVIVAAFQAFLLGGDGIYGFIMHAAASGVYVLAAALIYKAKKNKKTAIIGMAVGTVIMVVVMYFLNLYVTPTYFLVNFDTTSNYEAVKASIEEIIPLIVAFNVVKGIIDSIITFFVYKKVSPFLHR